MAPPYPLAVQMARLLQVGHAARVPVKMPSGGETMQRMVSEGRGWTFLTNQARVLLAIARDPTVQLRIRTHRG
ncbi:hypothetical protein ABZY36_27990 [Streptomyces sp. NPDC006627]|uniref:hypothetical protein n=1 Tax=Streptomyces sp. NPDC006627 TaxID=3154679 RepID=UPI0033B31977